MGGLGLLSDDSIVSGVRTWLVKTPLSEALIPSKGPAVPGGGQGEAGVPSSDPP